MDPKQNEEVCDVILDIHDQLEILFSLQLGPLLAGELADFMDSESVSGGVIRADMEDDGTVGRLSSVYTDTNTHAPTPMYSTYGIYLKARTYRHTNKYTRPHAQKNTQMQHTDTYAHRETYRHTHTSNTQRSHQLTNSRTRAHTYSNLSTHSATCTHRHTMRPTAYVQHTNSQTHRH